MTFRHGYHALKSTISALSRGEVDGAHYWITALCVSSVGIVEVDFEGAIHMYTLLYCFISQELRMHNGVSQDYIYMCARLVRL